MTILGGDYKPVEVEILDLVGYNGNGVFVILNPVKSRGRRLPDVGELFANFPVCILARIENNQVVNFYGETATLHDIDGEWHYRLRQHSSIVKLEPHTFFEVGNAK
ncbi:MAG: hypothetical protein A3I92_02485 [Candidatus Yanofskybacteria bacterium RIFCSPLOWO2_02_FULL_43_10b]|uniref:Uncharacterized protein n=1 Tax=Candidatus Yanofskybacteria bacterium RIFCSPLOWO2_02_FULL_43_10b TaxID=1802704 RepID=A0A1F8H7A8_9BACT|nr:MAG: hypothetical protein A3I92_02485 [Candidatus Yanofskybacteria bacterium RIFCSPLOWO2_02_FULL_43_10b]